jgi:predicted metal-binding membrane protein
MSTQPVTAGGSIARSRLQGMTRRHPEWWVAAFSAAAWAGLLVTELAAGSLPAEHQHHRIADTGAGRSQGMVWVAVMVTAMMAPLVLPTLRRLSLASLRSDRHRAQVLFLLGYLATWVAACGAISMAVITAEARVGRVSTMALVLITAATWQFVPVKRRALRRCDRTVPIAANSRRADVDRALFGVASAISCMTTCWGFMAVLAATGHGIGAMASLFVIQMYERIADRYVPVAGAAVLAISGAWALAAGPF